MSFIIKAHVEVAVLVEEKKNEAMPFTFHPLIIDRAAAASLMNPKLLPAALIPN